MTDRLVVIGDVGGPEYHAGDEALLDVAVTELRARGYHDIVVVSKDPADTAARYGVSSIAPFGFSATSGPAGDRERELLLRRVVDGDAGDPNAVDLRTAVSSARGLLVAGGGNLSASWPHLVFERVALLQLAARHSVPIVFVGQTVGPLLTSRQSDLLATAFSDAAVVGVREPSSRTIVHSLAPTCTPVVHVDDAIAITHTEVVPELPGEYVAMVLHRFTRDPETLAAVCDLVRSLHASSSLPVLLLPNTGRLDDGTGAASGTDSDVAVARELCAAVGDPGVLVAAPLLPVRELASAVRSAAAVVSTRFHPLVFGLSANVPCLGLSTDLYTATKLDGALRHAGLPDWRLPVTVVTVPLIGELFSELWERRCEIADHLGKVTPGWMVDHTVRWDDVARALARGDGARFGGSTEPAETLAPRLDAAVRIRSFDDAANLELHASQRQFAQAEEYAHSLRATLDRRDEEILNLRALAGRVESDLAAARAETTRVVDERDRAEASAHAARVLNGELVAKLAPRDAVVLAEARKEELEAVYATKVWRWSQGPRRIYRQCRTAFRLFRQRSR
jgi:Uncharacterized conserved protein